MKIPNHLGIIIDGNRRWAEEKGLPAFEGHKEGLETVKKTVTWCKERGIKILTLFVFSTENWKRSKKEVGYLMKLLKQAFSKENVQQIYKKEIKVRVIGQREGLARLLQKSIKEVEKLTKNNQKMILNFALSYGGRAEIVQAFKNIIKKKLPLKEITEDVVSQNLWTSDLDLIIRTGKEQRISNFLIWQGAYSELYFSKKYWPDFTEKDLDTILRGFARRQRRFGK